jgi:hypothetical protein
MRWLRFSIAGLMVLVSVIALGFAALRSGSGLWASALFTLAGCLATAALIGALTLRGPARRSWVGAALACWIYLIAAFAPWSSTEVRPYLITTKLLDALYPAISGKVLFKGAYADALLVTVGDLNSYATTTGEARDASTGSSSYTNYQRIGHSLMAILSAFAGGGMARLLVGPPPRPTGNGNTF